MSLTVPNISFQRSGNDSETSSLTEVKVIRSISDVVKARGQVSPQLCSKECKTPLSARKTKEERRISNRQKLLTIAKRHSGFLKRPEILETVYSVEEDGEGGEKQQRQDGANQSNAGDSTESSSSAKESNKGIDTIECHVMHQIRHTTTTDSPSRGSTSSGGGVGCVLTGFRYRLDSDQLTGSDNDFSTDDESTRIFYSETTDGSISCSQPCSRRSSYGGLCSSLPCSRRSSYGHTPVGGCSQCCSRRSSYGTTTTTSDDNNEKEQTTFNRVMTNHKTVTKPKDVKFKRISKAKSRSLEELRGKLKWHIIDAEDDDEDEEEEQKSTKTVLQKAERGKLQHCASLDRETLQEQNKS